MSSVRSKLREELTSQLIPILKESGFNGPEKISGNKLLHSFKRETGNRFHFVIIQLENRQKPRFLLNLEIYTNDGKLQAAAIVKAKPGSGLNSWFTADSPSWHKLIGIRKTNEKKAVQACILKYSPLSRPI